MDVWWGGRLLPWCVGGGSRSDLAGTAPSPGTPAAVSGRDVRDGAATTRGRSGPAHRRRRSIPAQDRNRCRSLRCERSFSPHSSNKVGTSSISSSSSRGRGARPACRRPLRRPVSAPSTGRHGPSRAPARFAPHAEPSPALLFDQTADLLFLRGSVYTVILGLSELLEAKGWLAGFSS